LHLTIDDSQFDSLCRFGVNTDIEKFLRGEEHRCPNRFPIAVVSNASGSAVWLRADDGWNIIAHHLFRLSPVINTIQLIGIGGIGAQIGG